jgi:geranylgeranyl pyrophosphate synthase
MLYPPKVKKNSMTTSSSAQKALSILSQKSEKAHTILRQIVFEDKLGIESTDKAIEQYLLRWNDKSRPGTLAIACEAVGRNSEVVVPLQVAFSFIDVTMDIHDDIIDESVTKKNVKTIYGKLGKETALLMGDKFMVKGFYYLHKAVEDLPKGLQTSIMDESQNFLAEVVGAHISEAKLKKRKWSVTPEKYLEVLHQKAADIEGRMRIGAIYGGGNQKEIDALGKYGRNLGILLFVRAEYVDIFEPEELLNRAQHECLPLQILYAIQKRGCGKKIRELLSKESLQKSDSDELLDMIQNTQALSILRSYLEEKEKEAMQALSNLENSPAKACLEFIITSTLEDL